MKTWVEADLPMRQFVVLLALREAGSLKMGDISNLFGITHPSATGIVHRLRNRGLVRLSRDSMDERVRWVRMTPEGEALVLQLIQEASNAA